MKTDQHKYTQIANDILGRINRGVLAPGARLPGVRILGEQFGCNYHTARHALAELAKHGHVESRPGSGTFVASGTPAPPRYPRRATRQLGVLLPLKQWNHYVIRLIDQLHHSAERKGLKLNIRTVNSINLQSAELANEFCNQACCAIIVPWLGNNQHPADLHDFVRASELPVVLPEPIQGLENLCYRARPEGSTDMPQGHYFQALGYRNIALLGSHAAPPEPLRRKAIQYINWTNRENIPNLMAMVDHEGQGEFNRIIDRWLPMKGQLAVIACCDELALAFMQACQKRGIDIPGDFALMGQNNHPDGLRSTPSLSTMPCPYKRIADGMIAHGLALACGTTEQLRDPEPQAFEIRESCGGRRKLGAQVKSDQAQLSREL